MKQSLDTAWRVFFSAGLLALAASCSNQLPSGTESREIGQPQTLTAIPTGTPSASPTEQPVTPTPTSTLAPTVTRPGTLPPLSASPTRSSNIRTIDLSQNGQTINLALNEEIHLELGTGYVWVVTVEDPTILLLEPNSTNPNTQGVYKAAHVGQTKLNAAGTPTCYNAVPRCLAPSRLFSISLRVS